MEIETSPIAIELVTQFEVGSDTLGYRKFWGANIKIRLLIAAFAVAHYDDGLWRGNRMDNPPKLACLSSGKAEFKKNID